MNSATLDDMGMPPADMRQNLRSPLIIQKVHIDADRPVFFGYSKNLSRSGLFIATTNKIEIGDQIDLEIPLPMVSGQAVRCRCEVVWRRPISKLLPFEPGIGLKFIDMPDEICQQIDDWIRNQLEDEQ